MNIKAGNFIKDVSFTLSSNLINLVISTLVILIVPKLIGVEEYGYWQLYLFYSTYVGLLHFGWNDGIYLKIGGERYKSLDKNLYFSQFYMLLFSQIIITIIITVFSSFYINDINKMFVWKILAFCIVITNTRFMLLYILQATDRFKAYAAITILEKLVYLIIFLILIFVGIDNYESLIKIDIIGKIFSLILAFYYCKEIVFQKISNFQFYFEESFQNISMGIKLLLANIMSLLIVGNVRFGIENTWDIETFGQISLMLSLVNFLLIFISATGIVLFPILRRSSVESLPSVYITIKTLLMMLIFFCLILYFPLKVFLVSWLPEYSQSLIFLSFIIPVIAYEGKMSLLINTYLKTLRKEKILLKINALSFFISLITTYITTIVLENLNIAVLSILILLALRNIIGEWMLTKLLDVKIAKDLLLETLLIIIFAWTTWSLETNYALLIYMLALCMYFLVKSVEIKKATLIMWSLFKFK